MYENNVLISIIIPVYSSEKYIKQCLDSLTKQTYKNIEIIVVDDGSTDDSLAVCDKCAKKDCRIRVISKSNLGSNMARAAGFENSKGSYIMFVDSDDILMTDAVQYLYSLLISRKVDIAVGGYRRFIDLREVLDENKLPTEDLVITNNEDDALKWLFSGRINQSLDIYDDIIRVVVWAKLYKRSIIQQTDWYFSNYWTNEDRFEMLQWLSFAKNGLAITKKPVYLYRTNLASKTQSKYYNKTPEGKEIDQPTFAHEFRQKSIEYLHSMGKVKFDHLIEEYYVQMIRDGIVKNN